MSNQVVWFEVMGHDADKLKRFYGELLDWSFDSENPMNYGMVKEADPGTAGQIAGGIGQVPSDDAPGWITFYVKVDDLEAAVGRAEGLGSRVLLPVTELPDTRIAVVSDPEGNPLGLCADKTSS